MELLTQNDSSSAMHLAHILGLIESDLGNLCHAPSPLWILRDPPWHIDSVGGGYTTKPHRHKSDCQPQTRMCLSGALPDALLDDAVTIVKLLHLVGRRQWQGINETYVTRQLERREALSQP